MRWTLHIGKASRSLFVADSVSAVASALAPEFAEFIAFSSLFLVLRLSSSDALDRVKGLHNNLAASGRVPSWLPNNVATLDGPALRVTYKDSSGFNRLSCRSTTQSLI